MIKAGMQAARNYILCRTIESAELQMIVGTANQFQRGTDFVVSPTLASVRSGQVRREKDGTGGCIIDDELRFRPISDGILKRNSC